MNFIYENGLLAKAVAFFIGTTIMCLVVMIVWCHRRRELRTKRDRQMAIKLRQELSRNELVRAAAGEKSRLIIEMLKEEVHKDDNKKKENERKHSHEKFDLKRITAYADSIQRPSVSSSVESVVEGNIHLLAVNGGISAPAMVNMSTARLNKVVVDQNKTIRAIKRGHRASFTSSFTSSFRNSRKGSFRLGLK